MSARIKLLILLDVVLGVMSGVSWAMGNSADAYIAATVVVVAVYGFTQPAYQERTP